MPQTTDLNRMYDQLNQQFFAGELPKIPVSWNYRFTRAMGKTYLKRKNSKSPWRCTKISIKSDLSEQHLHKTMVHEMCHVWAIEKHQSQGHSALFWKKMTECGYPDGHHFEDESVRDKWQVITNTKFKLRQVVFFDNDKGETIQGFVERINKRTITVRTLCPRKVKWRVSPSLLRLQR